ncbi:MAG: hypothetical protein GXO79_04630 [Chlorobi bacterium]|nr:hypothetical protein [Chlorobiota bacterium]
MPDKKSIQPLLGDKYYHIYNRGNNYENIFFENRNYKYFISKYVKYLNNYIDTLAFCLLNNHFHLLIKIKDRIVINNQVTTDLLQIGKLTGQQFRKFFISYSMSINKQENRSGSLFLKNFKRIEIDSDDYLRHLIFYIHYNPQKHGMISDFRDYKYSSYPLYDKNKDTIFQKDNILVQQAKDLVLSEFFNNKLEFIEFHKYLYDEKKIIKFILE